MFASPSMATFTQGLAAGDLCQTNTALHLTDDCYPGGKKRAEPGETGSGSGGPDSQGGPACADITMTCCTLPGHVQLEVTQDGNVPDWLVSFLISPNIYIVSCFLLPTSCLPPRLFSLTPTYMIPSPHQKPAKTKRNRIEETEREGKKRKKKKDKHKQRSQPPLTTLHPRHPKSPEPPSPTPSAPRRTTILDAFPTEAIPEPATEYPEAISGINSTCNAAMNDLLKCRSPVHGLGREERGGGEVTGQGPGEKTAKCNRTLLQNMVV